MKGFKEFSVALEQYGYEVSNDFSAEEKEHVGKVWENVKSFLTDQNLVPSEKITAMENFGDVVPSFNSAQSLADIGSEAIIDLCKSCNISDSKLGQAAKAVAFTIAKYSSSNVVPEHFNVSTAVEGLEGVVVKELSTLYTSKAISKLTSDPKTAMEAFGQNIDSTMVDAKIAITITLLKFHRSLINRVMPTKPVDSNLVMFKAENLEVYDLSKASSSDASTRVKGTHRTPFVDLYKDPTPANTKPKLIVPLSANDAGGDYLIADGIIKEGVEANLFDLSMQSNVVGYNHVDYTDLVADGVKLKSLILEVTDTTDNSKENLVLNVLDRSGARFSLTANAANSADRICSLDEILAATKDSVKVDGTTTGKLSFLDANHYIELSTAAMGKINLMTAYARVTANVSATLKTKDGTAPLAAMNTAFGQRTFKIVGYELLAYYNEENLRKTTTAIRMLAKTFAYNVLASKNVVVDYSLIQTTPENVIAAINKAQAIGNDIRGLELLIDCLSNVKARIDQENAMPVTEYTKRILNDFVAGSKVKPYVYTGNITVNANVANLRSAEIWGDIRGLAEKALLEMVTRAYNESFYTQQLDPGEAPEWSVITSGYVADALLSVPSYYSAFNQGLEKNPNDTTELRRVLPNGTILNVYTTTFDLMGDKILMFPVRPQAPSSELNAAINCDRGTFVAQITPYIDGAGFKRVVANAREIPIVTNPVFIFVDVVGLSDVFSGVGNL